MKNKYSFLLGAFAGIGLSFQAFWRLSTNIREYNELSKKSLENLFPDYFDVKEVSLTSEERIVLEQELSLPNSDENEKRIWNNLCSYKNVSVYETNPIKDQKGNCIFVAPNLVLTNNHVSSLEIEGEFYDNLGAVLTKDKTFNVKEKVAISPRYDLALVRIIEDNPNFGEVPLGSLDNEITSLILYTCGNNTFCSEGYPLKRNLTLKRRKDGLFLSTNGILDFPSIIVEEILPEGYSGSPVFNEGRLIGLVSQACFEKDGLTIISDHVYDFISRAVQEQSE